MAGEKAGIIKDGKMAVVREQEPEALAVLEERCDEVGATMLLEFRDWEVLERLHAVGGQAFVVRGVHDTYDELFLPMFGEHAVHNAAAAIVACEALLGERARRRARCARRSPACAGRAGSRSPARQPAIVLDGAHNPAGAEALAAALREFFPWERLHLVVSISANKDVAGIAAPLAPLADVVYATRNESERSGDVGRRSPRRSAAAVRPRHDARRRSPRRSTPRAPRPRADDLICVTGSLYTVADARRALGLTA